MSANRTGNVIKNSWASLLERFVQITVQFALRSTFIYTLGNEYTGISGLFTDILHVLSLMELGLDSSMIYSLYKPLAQNDKKRIAGLLHFYRNAFNIIGFTIFFIGFACTFFLQYIVKDVPNITEDIRIIFMLYIASSGFSYFLIYKSVLLRADQKSRIISKWSIVVLIIESVLEVISLIIFRNFYAYLVIHIIATVGKNLIISRISTKEYCEYFFDNSSRLKKEEKNELYKNLACITIYNMSGVVINSTDSIFISAFTGTVEVAIIGNFTLIITGIRTAVNQIINSTKPSIGNLAATSSDNKQEIVFNRMNFIAFWVSCICCTCLFTLLNPFVGDIWLNPTYKTSVSTIALLVINFFIAVMVFPVESFRVANGLFTQGWMRPAIMTFLNIFLDFVLGKSWGILGIFMATTVSRVATQVWYDPWLIYKNVFKDKVTSYYKKYVCYSFVTIISCTIAYYLCESVSLKWTIAEFILKMLISFIVSNIIVIFLFQKDEGFEYVFRITRKIFTKIKRE